MKRGRTFLAMLTIAVFIVGCATAPKEPEKPLYSPTFDFAPPNSAAPNSAQVSVAVVSPHFPESDWFRYRPYDYLRPNMEKDFIELLNAKGFTVRGPFKTRDEMTYPDKEGSDLVLIPDLELQINDLVSPNEEGLIFTVYRLKGRVSVGGRLNLSLMEPLSGEKMWTKSIDMPTKNVIIATKKTWPKDQMPTRGPNGYVYLLAVDERVNSEVGKAVEDSYREIMDATWKYLDPKELALIKEQCKKLREKIMIPGR